MRIATKLSIRPLVAAIGALALVAAACSIGTTAGVGSAGRLHVVAAENFWGSIAAQLGGPRVSVTSLINNPNADPHAYEPTASDARSVATARLVVFNGIGYDPWVEKLLTANPAAGRAVLNVGDLVGVPVGGNPHQWYSPGNVQRVTDAIAAQYARAEPAHAGDFQRMRSTFETVALKDYHGLIATINSRYGGTPVGASESIFQPMAQALGLNLLTPYSFLRAISEGTEPSAADKSLIDRQIRTREIKVYVYNSQNATPDIQRQIQECHAAGIPVTTITETLTPAGASFQAWQTAQLQALASTLQATTGR